MIGDFAHDFGHPGLLLDPNLLDVSNYVNIFENIFLLGFVHAMHPAILAARDPTRMKTDSSRREATMRAALQRSEEHATRMLHALVHANENIPRPRNDHPTSDHGNRHAEPEGREGLKT